MRVFIILVLLMQLLVGVGLACDYCIKHPGEKETWEAFLNDVNTGKYPKQYVGEETCDNKLWSKHLWITNPGWDRCFNCGKTKPNNWKLLEHSK